MKVALIGQKGIPAKEGGVERHVEDLAVRLSGEGVSVLAYSRKNYTGVVDKTYKYKGVKVVNLPGIPTKNLDAITHTFLACFHLLFRKVDVIHFHSIGPSSLIWLVKILKPRTPVVATFHTQCYLHQKWSNLAKAYLKFGERMCCKWADEVIAVSEGLKDYAKRIYGRRANYLPNGITADKKHREAGEIKKWGLDKGNYILTVSRLVRHKGVHYLVDAYKQLNTDKKLVIVGGSSNTDDYVRELKEKAGGDPNIIFTGSQSGMILEELFSNACLFVQPSESEGLSIALLEAMAYGLPIITSDIPENKEVIKETGLVFENKNTKDLMSKMEYFLSRPDLMQEKGRSAKIRVEENFNWDNIAKGVEDIYKRVTAKKIPIKVKFIKFKRKVEVK
jgi:glycosyltransferase involved in cell wall biosynthesis